MSHDLLHQIQRHLNQHILGSDQAVRLLLISLIAKGHALITGSPGIGKTSLAQKLSECLSVNFNRIQFTPDLLPSDIMGYNIFKPQEGTFEFIAGPVFTHLLLADEINRASPRTQSALLEAMNDSQVTIDGVTTKLEDPFFVIATQNDRSATGVFPLPEAQLDRFLVSIPMALPSEETQLEILQQNFAQTTPETTHFLTRDSLKEIQAQAQQIPLSENLQRYLLALCQHVRLQTGSPESVSVRGTLALQRAAQATALLEGADHVLPDHLQFIFPHVLRHRLPEDDIHTPDQILKSALENTPVP